MMRQGSWGLTVSLVLAFVLTLIPLPEWLDAMRPYWVALVMMYWHLEVDRIRHLGQAFALGLLLDLMTGSLLGQHALGLVIINFLVARFRSRIRFFPPWQQALVVGALLFNDRVVQLWIIGLLERGWPSWSWWLPPIVAIAIWPWLFLALDAVRHRQRQPQR
ncbi:MAG: rod shape-determining protein MreD [Pseudomonadota bacterium]